ncbi:MAG: T9SS type A sorting domain-containing protein [Saprospiraceae bacterium]|nr:T9SS type A sorting domain-containing protein [Saprospiraceae bacterium]
MKLFVLFTALMGVVSATFAQDKGTVSGSSLLIAPISAHRSLLTENKNQWDPQVKSFAASVNKSSVSEEEMELLRQRPDSHKEPQITRMRNNPVKLNVNYEGNKGTGSVPPDNTMAVSTNGFVISGINSNLFFSRADGTVLYTQALSDFFTDLSLGGGFFDPRIIYDIPSQRFIIVALSGSQSDMSTVCIAFSESEDPGLGWNFYKLPGDILEEDMWFDYPNIAVTEKELYVTGNMFTDQNQFRYSSIYQINKEDGYAGKSLTYKHYTKMKEPITGQTFFNITPVSMGWTSNRPVGIQFLTNDPRGGSNITVLCKTTGTLDQNPKFEVVDVKTGDNYEVSPTVPQKGTSNVLQTGDCRIQYAVELNGVIHFVLKAKINNKAGLYYGRYNLNDLTLHTSVYAEPNSHVSYPSLAPMGSQADDSRMMIQYLRCSGDIFPEQVAMVVDGTDNNFTYSDPIVIKDGDSFVNALDTNNERWGDYSCVARRFYNDLAETWVGGCFGRARFGTWIGQFVSSDAEFRDIFASKTVINPGDTIEFQFIGSDTLSNAEWTAPGGSFISDTSASYDSLGSYPLSITALNQKGDTIRLAKDNFIHVVPKVFAPTAQFEADKILAFEGDTIQLFDRSTNEPTRWKWTLTGGSPSASTEANPKVVYAKKGQYNIVLNAKNSAGEDVEVKQKYIKIEAKAVAPLADFTADKRELIAGDTVRFTDLSSNAPDSWQWLIEGPTQDTFTNQNPVVAFTVEGSYDITLKASNQAGENVKKEEGYITVGSASTQQNDWINTTRFFPNPIVSDRFYLQFDLQKAERLKFDLYGINGSFIKTLINKDIKAGRNEFSFNSEMLESGTYLLKITATNHKHLTLPFVVVN